MDAQRYRSQQQTKYVVGEQGRIFSSGSAVPEHEVHGHSIETERQVGRTGRIWNERNRSLWSFDPRKLLQDCSLFGSTRLRLHSQNLGKFPDVRKRCGQGAEIVPGQSQGQTRNAQPPLRHSVSPILSRPFVRTVLQSYESFDHWIILQAWELSWSGREWRAARLAFLLQDQLPSQAWDIHSPRRSRKEKHSRMAIQRGRIIVHVPSQLQQHLEASGRCGHDWSKELQLRVAG